CTAYNADFDGDQMAVHVPLSAEAQAEARFLMLASNNLLKPSDGRPVTVPTQDMVLGSYYLTLVKPGEPGDGKCFRDFNEALMAYSEGVIGLHATIRVRVFKEINGVMHEKLLKTTVGRMIFNMPIPQDLGYVDRTIPGNELDLEIDFLVGKKELAKIIEKSIRMHGTSTTSEVLDKIKAQGYKYSTRSAITISVSDAVIPPQKKGLIDEAEKRIDEITKKFRRGLLSDDERFDHVIQIWDETTKKVADALNENLDQYNPIFMMVNSGARGAKNQIRQLAGMRGLIANTPGRTIEVPIRANYREGLNVLEYFVSSRGARKGLADTALRTADSGYLTRRLVDVSQDVIIREHDCGTSKGINVYAIKDGNEMIEPLTDRLIGRYPTDDVIDPASGEIIAKKDVMINDRVASLVVKAGVEKVRIRSVLTCESKHGVCAKCYGANLANGESVNVGEAVGIIAAQSIGEPGTQLTMRTFHTGGIASAEDITQGLPRVEELFEARKPKHLAIIAEIGGVVSISEDKRGRQITITNAKGGEAKSYSIPYGSRMRVNEEQHIEKGELLTEGSVNPHDVLMVSGIETVQDYIIQEVQRVYRMQGVDINDKHIEVIVRQMMRKLRIDDPGDSSMMPGALVEKIDFDIENEKLREIAAETGEPQKEATSGPVLLGITKASLATESWLSAASFQETTRVLTEAAIKGKVDPLLGLKENVIIGKLVPAGTGMECYRNVEIENTL
ncbi:MAG: DNA-directed RNA polymerase subunit beta', partial [Clostridia bacterium]|nr:DNA-directed RNA polymerase subunit beta' [Clostridia bacterium]